MQRKQVLMIDNFDSFVHNLADEFARLACDIAVYRSNWEQAKALAYIESQQPDLIVFSPGPGHPRDASLCHGILKYAAKNQKILGVCLGHQCIVEHFGGIVDHAPVIMHGKPSLIEHDNSVLFNELPNPLQVARYHSLVATQLPESLIASAHCDNVIMAVHHKSRPIYGLQFHPESVLTPNGHQLIKNVLES